jgi:hypothetical protein
LLDREDALLVPAIAADGAKHVIEYGLIVPDELSLREVLLELAYLS